MPLRPVVPHLLRDDAPSNPFPGRAALERRLGHGILHQLGSNEGLDIAHHALSKALGEPIATLARGYGDPEGHAVRERLAQRYALDIDMLIVDAGADALMALALRTLCSPGQVAITSAGTYPSFAYFARSAGCHLIEAPYQQGNRMLAPDLSLLASLAAQHQAQVVYLANPDNPSGHVFDDATVAEFAASLPAYTTLILDEAYFDFRQDMCKSMPLDGVVRLRTFSKAHGLAGLRIGYAIMSAELAGVMNKARIHYAVSSVALAAACVMLDHDEEVRAHIQSVIQQRGQLAQRLREAGADVLPSATNFLAVRCPSPQDAQHLQHTLLAQGTAVHRPGHEQLGHILRITTTKEALDDAFLSPLWAYLKTSI